MKMQVTFHVDTEHLREALGKAMAPHHEFGLYVGAAILGQTLPAREASLLAPFGVEMVALSADPEDVRRMCDPDLFDFATSDPEAPDAPR